MPDIASLTSAKPSELQSLSSNTRPSVQLAVTSPDYTGSLSDGVRGFGYHSCPTAARVLDTSFVSVFGFMAEESMETRVSPLASNRPRINNLSYRNLNGSNL